MTRNTRSGVDGGEHSATLDCVMAGGLTPASARSSLRPSIGADRGADRGHDRVQIAAHTGAHIAAAPRTSHAPATQHAMM
jgi:hypothetical protein